MNNTSTKLWTTSAVVFGVLLMIFSVFLFMMLEMLAALNDVGAPPGTDFHNLIYSCIPFFIGLLLVTFGTRKKQALEPNLAVTSHKLNRIYTGLCALLFFLAIVRVGFQSIGLFSLRSEHGLMTIESYLYWASVVVWAYMRGFAKKIPSKPFSAVLILWSFAILIWSGVSGGFSFSFRWDDLLFFGPARDVVCLIVLLVYFEKHAQPEIKTE